MERTVQTRKDADPQVSGGRTEYTVEAVDKMGGRLRALPAIEDSRRTLNKHGAVRRLAAEIRALQERGYTIEQVAESLCGVGLEITTPTLKSYLQRMKKENGKAIRKKAKVSASPADPPPPPEAPAAVPGPRALAPSSGALEATPPTAKKASDQRPNGNPKSTNEEFLATDRKTL